MKQIKCFNYGEEAQGSQIGRAMDAKQNHPLLSKLNVLSHGIIIDVQTGLTKVCDAGQFCF